MIRKATLANVLAKVVGERPSLERGIGDTIAMLGVSRRPVAPVAAPSGNARLD